MTALTIEREPSTRPPGAATGSTILAIAVSLALLGLGYALKVVVEGGGAQVTAAGVTAHAPQGWLVEQGQNELLLRHPGDGQTLYAVSLLPSQGGDLPTLALETTLDRAGLYVGFQVTGQSLVRVGNREGQQVRYAFVTNARATGVARLVQGMDLYLPDGDGVIVISYEAPGEHFDSEMSRFDRFATSVTRAASP